MSRFYFHDCSRNAADSSMLATRTTWYFVSGGEVFFLPSKLARDTCLLSKKRKTGHRTAYVAMGVQAERGTGGGRRMGELLKDEQPQKWSVLLYHRPPHTCYRPKITLLFNTRKRPPLTTNNRSIIKYQNMPPVGTRNIPIHNYQYTYR